MLHIVIVQTSPFWTSIIAIFLNGESVIPIEYIGMVVCFAGVVIIAISKQGGNQTTYDPSLRNTGIVISFSLSWIYAFTCCFNRKLRETHFAVILFFHSGVGAILTIIFILAECLWTGNELRFMQYDLNSWSFLLLACLLDFLTLTL